MLNITPERLVVSRDTTGNDLTKLGFDTNYSYFAMREMVSVSHTFPTRNVDVRSSGGGKKGGSVSYNMPYFVNESTVLYTHNYGYPPIAFMIDAATGNAIHSGFPMQTNSGSMRFIEVRVTSTQILVRERSYVRDGALASFAINLKVYLTDNQI